MSDGFVEANTGTTAVREGYGFDVDALADWMTANVAGFAGPLTVEQFKGGQSNPTYRLVTPSRSFVLRRKPPGGLVPGAHAVDREARVQQALGAQGYPVATIHGLCTDDATIGTWFYVMEMVEGRIFWDTTFPDVGRDERPAYVKHLSPKQDNEKNQVYLGGGLDGVTNLFPARIDAANDRVQQFGLFVCGTTTQRGYYEVCLGQQLTHDLCGCIACQLAEEPSIGQLHRQSPTHQLLEIVDRQVTCRTSPDPSISMGMSSELELFAQQ